MAIDYCTLIHPVSKWLVIHVNEGLDDLERPRPLSRSTRGDAIELKAQAANRPIPSSVSLTGSGGKLIVTSILVGSADGEGVPSMMIHAPYDLDGDDESAEHEEYVSSGSIGEGTMTSRWTISGRVYWVGRRGASTVHASNARPFLGK
ncbi:hypothetical protein L210DRAFT_3653369 [Boletus edulis BED1]|uniref:Uncharacterized protein n=1 Tax=Boletus edulis BED1 TaxID=1328754 RepID=A0AAD4BFI0_BOLED|nr:hypothetical protein L210DRAFT_3653369 [Boletus edulis BED1]